MSEELPDRWNSYKELLLTLKFSTADSALQIIEEYGAQPEKLVRALAPLMQTTYAKGRRLLTDLILSADPSFSTVILMLLDADPEIARGASNLVAELPADRVEAIPALIRGLEVENQVHVLVSTLSRIGEPAVQKLIEATSSEHAWRGAILALSRIGDSAKAAIPRLDVIAWTGTSERSLGAIDAFADLGPSTVPLLTRLLERHTNEEHRIRAAGSLSKMGALARPSLPVLKDRLHRTLGDERLSMAKAILAVALPESVWPRDLFSDTEPSEHLEHLFIAMRPLGPIDARDLFAQLLPQGKYNLLALLDLLTHSRTEFAELAEYWIEIIGEPAAEPLLKLLDSRPDSADRILRLLRRISYQIQRKPPLMAWVPMDLNNKYVRDFREAVRKRRSILYEIDHALGATGRPSRALPPSQLREALPSGAAAPPAVSAEPPLAAPDQAGKQGGDDEFHFLLQGPAVRGYTLRAHGRASLHFRYGLAPLDVLANVHHAALDDAAARDLDITLQLTPCGAVQLEGERRAVASMRKGRLQQPVSFQLLADEAPAVAASDDEHGVHVEFIIQGATVHQMLLRIDVLSAAAWDAAAPADGAPPATPQVTGAGPGLLARAAALAPPPSDQVRLSLAVDAGSLHLELLHLKDGAEWSSDSATTAQFDLAAVAVLAKQLRSTLAASYKVQAAAWQRFDGQVNDGDTALQQALRQALECAATAGSVLNKSLRADAGVARLLDYVETQVPDGARLTVSTDRVFLPWELLTPQTWSLNLTDGQRAKLPPLDSERFWGARFAVETVPRRVPVGQRMVDHLKASPRRVNVNLHPDIEAPGVPALQQPLAVHAAWAQRMQAAGQLDGPVNQTCLPMREVLQSAQHHASLIYLYCHGQSDDPFGGGDERLVLDDDCALSPGDLLGEADYGNAPIVFLNACESGAPSPLAFSQFLKGFCERGAIGLIATTHSVPIQFAAHFGPAVVDSYLAWHGSLAEMMRTLRRRHLALGNPVPLFYTLQCQLALPVSPATGANP